MNPENHVPEPTPAAPSISASDTPRRRRGKIANLPKSSRAKLNEMLEEGVPYRKIIENLGIYGKNLTENNISDWFKSGHQDWLKERAWLDDMRARHELAIKLVRENADCKIHEASLLIAATLVSELLRNFDPASLNASLKDDPLALVRLLNALSRLSRQGLSCEHHRDKQIEQKAAKDRWKTVLKNAGITR